ncbi:hypothetical protein JZ751_005672 [Albula glossodonta]|uniref:Uncharacterized protein n=1 Tax=Albula glossodonta TaxID=121402 RepID=A0A8T2N3V6_9TELE|nr:hypothetical protein JZ751_005672 [Albula glossodonta]
MDRKCFMGVARILLEELDLSSMVIGWYKLFPTSSMVDPTMAPLIRHSSQLSLESTVGPCCDRCTGEFRVLLAWWQSPPLPPSSEAVKQHAGAASCMARFCSADTNSLR